MGFGIVRNRLCCGTVVLVHAFFTQPSVAATPLNQAQVVPGTIHAPFVRIASVHSIGHDKSPALYRTTVYERFQPKLDLRD
jgi:hypothetical protein